MNADETVKSYRERLAAGVPSWTTQSEYEAQQWTYALADLKNVAHASDVSSDHTDAWAVKHDDGTHTFGYYSSGAFRRIADVSSPDALRSLGFMYERGE